MDQNGDLREKISAFLKEADNLIKSKNYDAAMSVLQQAKSLDPTNPYVQAFYERVEHFKQKLAIQESSVNLKPVSVAPSIAQIIESPKVEINEHKLREQIEKEYQAKFKDELQKIEKALIKRIETERIRFENEKNEVKQKYENKLKEVEGKFLQENKGNFESELSATEQRLREQFNAEQALLENEMKQRLENEFLRKLESFKFELEQNFNKQTEQEKQKSLEHENQLKQEFELKLSKEIEAFKSENDKLKKEELVREVDNIKRRLEQEYNTKLENEMERVKERTDEEKRLLQQQINIKQKELEEQTQRILASELQKIKDRENTEFEKRRKNLEEQIQAELGLKFSQELEELKKQQTLEYEQKVQQEKTNFEVQKEEFISQENEKIENIRFTLKKEMEEKFISKLETIQAQFTKAYDDKMELLGVYVPDTLAEKLALYKKRLTEFWVNGQPTVEQIHKLMSLKELLDLSFDDHSHLEMDVRIGLYISKIEESIKNKTLDPTKMEHLNELKKQFQINAVESSKLEPFILSLFMKLSTKGVILVVDDDELLLKSLEDELARFNYKVITATSVNEALEILENNVVDLIISDIKFPDTQMDGFSFFSLLQKHKHLGNIPFILMSVLGDGGIIRSGVQLGVDDYLTKPIDMDLLLAVVEGKLKRYKSFKIN
jgi:CheY-like chemotaxis protein